ncbi:PREDICTED: translation initiation factor IF-2-like, partial [Chinchilla lanigera]|uniref:translation initiation factor IF-2-like n=1 Tax=Chinchilla lanigera TaxID=34839 RepID=UPI000697DD73
MASLLVFPGAAALFCGETPAMPSAAYPPSHTQRHWVTAFLGRYLALDSWDKTEQLGPQRARVLSSLGGAERQGAGHRSRGKGTAAGAAIQAVCRAVTWSLGVFACTGTCGASGPDTLSAFWGPRSGCSLSAPEAPTAPQGMGGPKEVHCSWGPPPAGVAQGQLPSPGKISPRVVRGCLGALRSAGETWPAFLKVRSSPLCAPTPDSREGRRPGSPASRASTHTRELALTEPQTPWDITGQRARPGPRTQGGRHIPGAATCAPGPLPRGRPLQLCGERCIRPLPAGPGPPHLGQGGSERGPGPDKKLGDQVPCVHGDGARAAGAAVPAQTRRPARPRPRGRFWAAQRPARGTGRRRPVRGPVPADAVASGAGLARSLGDPRSRRLPAPPPRRP